MSLGKIISTIATSMRSTILAILAASLLVPGPAASEVPDDPDQFRERFVDPIRLIFASGLSECLLSSECVADLDACLALPVTRMFAPDVDAAGCYDRITAVHPDRGWKPPLTIYDLEVIRFGQLSIEKQEDERAREAYERKAYDNEACSTGEYIENNYKELARTLLLWHQWGNRPHEYEDWVCHIKPNLASLPQNYQARPGPSPYWPTLHEGTSLVWDPEIAEAAYGGVPGVSWRAWMSTRFDPNDFEIRDWRFEHYVCQEKIVRLIEPFLRLQCKTMKWDRSGIRSFVWENWE